jgi:tetratricopeptide (TPR) repeat protein
MSRLLLEAIRLCSLAALAVALCAAALVYFPLRCAGREAQQGRPDRAVDTYRRLLWLDRDSGVLNFNMGVALYRKGDDEQAAFFFNRASASRNPAVVQMAHYNSGNCWYRKGTKEQNPDLAQSFYRESLDHFDRALAYRSDDGDAAGNRELAARQLEDAARRSAAARQARRTEAAPGAAARPAPAPTLAGDREGRRDGRLQDGQKAEASGERGKRDDGAKARGEPPLASGRTMDAREAELLLDSLRRQERPGSLLLGTVGTGREREVEKNW